MAASIGIAILLFNVCFQIVLAQMTKQTFGPDVVQAAISKIQGSGIFADDRGFMKRVAWVESKFGRDLSTKWSSFQGKGGIWQIDPINLQDTQNRLNSKIKQQIKDKLGVDIMTLNRDNGDLTVPLNGAIAARAYLYMDPAPIPAGLNDQAQYWVTHYNKGGAGTVAKFLSDVASMPN